MNAIHIIGNLTKDPELKTQNDESAAWFTVAVNRVGGENTDFFFCKAKGKTAENLCKFKKKGDKLAVSGMMMSYRKDGDEYDRWMLAAYDVEYLSMRSSENSEAGRPDPTQGQSQNQGQGQNNGYRRRR